jgi:hypothetical protein
MQIYTHTDKQLQFTSTVNIGKYLVTVDIDGLPSGNFMAQGLKDYIHHTPSASAVMLEFHNFDGWKIALNDEQTLERMREVMQARNYPTLAAIVQQHKEAALQSGNLEQYWRTHLIPEIMHISRTQDLINQKDFNATLAWCNPVSSRFKLHPRAIRFIQSHWPAIVANHNNEESAAIVKTA